MNTAARNNALPPFSHKVAVAKLQGETRLRIAADAAALPRIAAALGLDSVARLSLDIRVNHLPDGLVTLEGTLQGEVSPVCVVTLEAFEQVIRTAVAMRFAPEALIGRMSKRAEAEEDEDFEAPDLIEEGEIDFGAVAVEFLALALAPHPRRPGAVFSGDGDEPEEKGSPFAVLAVLRDKL